MKQVKIFDRTWMSSKLEEDMNAWLEENSNLGIEDIKYAMHEGYHSALIIYIQQKVNLQ